LKQTCHESGHVLEGDVLVPLVLALSDLSKDEADGRHGAGDQRGKHQELEAPDQALVVKPANSGHGRNGQLKFDPQPIKIKAITVALLTRPMELIQYETPEQQTHNQTRALLCKLEIN
jgi:hypothetical protein